MATIFEYKISLIQTVSFKLIQYFKMRYELNRKNTSTVAEMRIQQNPRGKG